MPTYEYRCQDCGERLEVFQRFTEKALRVHAECGGALQKIFHPSGVVFKGSGYYVTDSRSNGKNASSASKSDTESNGSARKADKGTKTDNSEKSSTSTKSAAAAD